MVTKVSDRVKLFLAGAVYMRGGHRGGDIMKFLPAGRGSLLPATPMDYRCADCLV